MKARENLESLNLNHLYPQQSFNKVHTPSFNQSIDCEIRMPETSDE